ncbi:hypothetical protein ACFL20_02650 [Spirochaetota bacterium]
MRKIILFSILLIPLASCNLLRDSIKVDSIVDKKDKIQMTGNPARKYILERRLRDDYLIEMKGVLVKNVTESTHIDYEFCVIVDVPTKKGLVECYIYTKNIRIISDLKMGKTKIDLSGKFSRFFTMLDDYYTKIEIVDASIEVHEPEKKKEVKDNKTKKDTK